MRDAPWLPPWQSVYRQFRSWRTWASGIAWARRARAGTHRQGPKRHAHRGDHRIVVCQDGAKRVRPGTPIGWAKDMFQYEVEVVKRDELLPFKVLTKRWIAERTVAWLRWSRGLSKDCEIRHTSAETMIHIAFANRSLRRVI